MSVRSAQYRNIRRWPYDKSCPLVKDGVLGRGSLERLKFTGHEGDLHQPYSTWNCSTSRGNALAESD